MIPASVALWFLITPMRGFVPAIDIEEHQTPLIPNQGGIETRECCILSQLIPTVDGQNPA